MTEPYNDEALVRRARELLAAECAKDGLGPVGFSILQGMHVSGFADICLRAIVAALGEGRAVPAGYVLVPVEPTEAMLVAEDGAIPDPDDEDPFAWGRASWAAMLAASGAMGGADT